MKSGSTSIDRHAELQAPQWMQAIDCVMSIIASGSTTYSRSGGSPSGRSHGTTLWTFFQWTASMSTIRSFSTGMLPNGSTTIVPAPSSEVSEARLRCVLQASDDLPLMRTPHEPQMAAWHEQRMPIEPSCSPFAWRMPSRTERSGSRSTSNSCQYGGWPDSGSKRRILRVNSAIGVVLVLTFLGFPLRDRHLGVRQLRRPVAVDRQVDVLEPLVVVALRVVRAVLRAARLLPLERADDDALRVVEHEAELHGAQQVLVEDRALVVDRDRLRLLLQPLDDLEPLAQAVLVAEHRRVLVHGLAELGLDLRHAAAGPLAAHDLLEALLLLLEEAVVCLGRPLRLRDAGGVLARATPEDERVEQRVRAEPVAAVHRHARHLPGGVQAGDAGEPADVRLHPAHRVVVAGLDVDRFAGDVDAGEVAADVHDLAQRLVDALARHDGDVEGDGAVGEAAPLVDLRLLGARDHVARGQLHLVRRVVLHEAVAVGVVEMRALAARALGDEQPVPG